MKHRKRYKRTGIGVELLCGSKVMAASPYRLTNWQLSPCGLCGTEVETIGCSPDTDRVHERSKRI